MTITALITTRNRAGLLREALESVQNQQFCGAEAIEILVVDDASTDDTAAVVAACCPAARYLKTRQGTAAGSRNIGIAAATGDWIAFLDDDDIWLPQKLRVCCDAIRAHPDAQFVISSARICDWDLQPGGIWQAPDLHAFPSMFEAFLAVVLTPSALLIRRPVFDAVGLFDSAVPRIEDRDLFLRLALHGVPGVSLHDREPLVLYRIRPQGAVEGEMAYHDYLGTMQVVRRHLSAATATPSRVPASRRRRLLRRIRGQYTHALVEQAGHLLRRADRKGAGHLLGLALRVSPLHALRGSCQALLRAKTLPETRLI